MNRATGASRPHHETRSLRPGEIPSVRGLLSRFNVAFSLMSIIPLLTCVYVVTVRFFSIAILEGMNGV